VTDVEEIWYGSLALNYFDTFMKYFYFGLGNFKGLNEF